jgi:hypothetical protein
MAHDIMNKVVFEIRVDVLSYLKALNIVECYGESDVLAKVHFLDNLRAVVFVPRVPIKTLPLKTCSIKVENILTFSATEICN